MNWCDLSLEQKIILVTGIFGRIEVERLAVIIFLLDKIYACKTDYPRR